MPRLADLWFRLKAALFPGRFERELDREIGFHLAMQADELRKQGLPPEEARREAQRRFGGLARERETIRDAWGVGWIADARTDAARTLRHLLRRPGSAMLGIVTLAIGIGATVAIASVARGLLLRPLPVRDEAGLRVFWSDYNWRGVEFDFAKERLQAFDRLAAFSTDLATLRTDQGGVAVMHGVVSAELFDVLGTAPQLGRTFRAGEDRPGAEPTIVLSHQLWQNELGGAPDIVGRRIVLGGEPTTVIGVMPRGFYFPAPEFRAWRPLMLDPAASDYQGNGWLVLLGRVSRAAGEPAVAGDIAALAKALGERFTYPVAWDKTKGAYVRTLRQYLHGDARPVLLLLLGAVAMVLLMACANTAALILARTTDRAGELSLRVALGAGRGRLIRQIVTESLVLSSLAGLLGATLAASLFGVLVARLPLGTFGGLLRMDWAGFLIAFGLSIAVGLLVAALPVRALLQGRLAGIAGERSSPGLRRGPGRAHPVLVGVEVALAVILATGSALFVRSVAKLAAIDPGFDPTGVVAVTLVTSESEMPGEVRRQLFRDAVERAGAVPGIVHAAVVSRLPVRDGGWQGPVEIEGRADLDGPNRPNSLFRPVSPAFFDALGIAIVRGRGFEPTDRQGGQAVTIVSEGFARLAWPGQDPIGRRIRTGVTGDTTWTTVVGIAEEARLVRLTGDNPLVMYVPMEQLPFALPGVNVVARASGDPDAALAAITRSLRGLDPRIAIDRPTNLGAAIETSLAEPLRLRFLLSLFAVMAVTLGAVGVYGVVSYAVARRQAEFGVRLALGATPSRVVAEVVGGGMRPVIVGALGGLAGAALLARSIAGFLYGVTPADLPSYLAATGALLLAGLIASVMPGWRAGRVDPVRALRAD
ncbi:MAG: FtsX-like permease family protein [Gemmatimonadetes bacterium]|nr:FtsX-like permease family protein [Gemmatimonadota bacterium]